VLEVFQGNVEIVSGAIELFKTEEDEKDSNNNLI